MTTCSFFAPFLLSLCPVTLEFMLFSYSFEEIPSSIRQHIFLITSCVSMSCDANSNILSPPPDDFKVSLLQLLLLSFLDEFDDKDISTLRFSAVEIISSFLDWTSVRYSVITRRYFGLLRRGENALYWDFKFSICG